LDLSVYEAEYLHEMSHWWYVERRRLFGRIIRSYFPEIKKARCADIGASTGANLTLFSELGVLDSVGLEYQYEAIQLAKRKSSFPILQGSGENLPFSNDSFDLVTCTDVLEHITNDDSTIREINRVLKPGGYVLITVPAFQSLWGHQDEVSHHLRRYTRRDIEKIVTQEGFEIMESFYFNWIMFLPVWIIRLISRLVSFKMRSEGDINSPTLNKMMMIVFRLDCVLARRIPFPFGVSVLIFARSTSRT